MPRESACISLQILLNIYIFFAKDEIQQIYVCMYCNCACKPKHIQLQFVVILLTNMFDVCLSDNCTTYILSDSPPLSLSIFHQRKTTGISKGSYYI